MPDRLSVIPEWAVVIIYMNQELKICMLGVGVL